MIDFLIEYFNNFEYFNFLLRIIKCDMIILFNNIFDGSEVKRLLMMNELFDLDFILKWLIDRRLCLDIRMRDRIDKAIEFNFFIMFNILRE